MVHINERFEEISPLRIHRALSGLSYPATKPSIVRFIQRKKPDNAIYLRVRELPQKAYKNETSILKALGIAQSSVKKTKKRSVPEVMTIPEQLALSGPSLLIAFGKQDMDVYATQERELRLLRSFKVPRKRYSDTEGHFKIRGKKGVVRSGVPREISQDAVFKEFLREASSYFKTLRSSAFSDVILFVPSHLKNDIVSAFPAPLKKKVTQTIEGNFRKSHPKTLLQKIKGKRTKSTKATSTEARKILVKADRARRMIKGRS